MGYVNILLKKIFFKAASLLLLVTLFTVLSACGGGGDNPGPDPIEKECDADHPYCETRYDEFRIDTVDNKIWLTTNDEKPTRECFAKGRLTGEVSFIDMSPKDEITWESSDDSVFTVTNGSENTTTVSAVSVGVAEVILKLRIKGRDPIVIATKRLVVKESSENVAPVAVAGDDIEVDGGEQVTVDGKYSYDFDGSIIRHNWSSEGISITSNDNIVTTFIAPESTVDKNYELTLTVTDDVFAEASDSLNLKVNAVLPVALGTATKVHEGEEITLDGSESHFNSDKEAIRSYLWEQIDIEEGYEVVIENPSDEDGIVEFNAPMLKDEDKETGKELKFRLTVTNELGKSASVEITTVILNEKENLPPVAAGGIIESDDEGNVSIVSEAYVKEGEEVCLDASESIDNDREEGVANQGIIEFNWIPSPDNEYAISVQSAARTCFNAPSNNLKEDTTLRITLQVKDAEQATGEKVITVNVLSENQAPVIDQIDYQKEDGYVNLSAEASDPDADGSIAKYTWSENEDDITLLSFTGETTRFKSPIRKDDAEYTVKLTVEDDEGGTVSKEKVIPIVGIDLAPTNLNISYIDENHSILTWDDMGEGAVSYRVYWSEGDNAVDTSERDSCSMAAKCSDATDGNSFALDNLKDDSNKYNYKVTAFYADGAESKPSADTAVYLPAIDSEEIKLVNDISRPSPEPGEQYSYMEVKWPEVEGAKSYKVVWSRNDGISTGGEYPFYGEKVITAEADDDGYIHFQNRDAFAVFEETNLYHYQVYPITENGDQGRVSSAKDYYALAGRWKDLQNVPDYRVDYMVAEVNGRVFIMGGLITGMLNVPLATTYEVDLETGEFHLKTPMMAHIAGAAICTSGNKIYVVGGYNRFEAGGVSSRVFSYDVDKDEWEELNSLNTSRYHAACVVNQDVLYVSGGESRTSEDIVTLSSTEILDLSTQQNAWRENENGLNVARSYHSMSIIDGEVVAFGGANDQGEFIASMEEYSYSNWSISGELPKEILSPKIIDKENGLHIIGVIKTDDYRKVWADLLVGDSDYTVKEIKPINSETTIGINPLLSLEDKVIGLLIEGGLVAVMEYDYYGNIVSNTNNEYLGAVNNSVSVSGDFYFIGGYEQGFSEENQFRKIGFDDLRMGGGEIVSLTNLEKPVDSVKQSECLVSNNSGIYRVGYKGEDLFVDYYNPLFKTWSDIAQKASSQISGIDEVNLTKCGLLGSEIIFPKRTGGILVFNTITRTFFSEEITIENGNTFPSGIGEVSVIGGELWVIGNFEWPNPANNLKLNRSNKKWEFKSPQNVLRRFQQDQMINGVIWSFFGEYFDDTDELQLIPERFDIDLNKWTLYHEMTFSGKESLSPGFIDFLPYESTQKEGKVYFVGGTIGFSTSNQKWVFY